MLTRRIKPEQFEKLKELPFKKRGQHFYIGELHNIIISPIGTAAVIAAATVIVMSDHFSFQVTVWHVAIYVTGFWKTVPNHT